MFLYHICRANDKGDLSVGYIGISKNPSNRWKAHKRGGNKLLLSAYSKYDDIIEYIVCKGSLEDMLIMEKKLRPNKKIGWNIAIGGGLPPKNSFRGMKHSEKTKEKISASRKGLCTGDDHHYRKSPMTDVHREKMSKAKLGKRFKRTIVVCPHCGKDGGSNLMLRYHFDNCKHVITPVGFFDNISDAIDGTGFAEQSIRTWCSSRNRKEWSLIERNKPAEENNDET